MCGINGFIKLNTSLEESKNLLDGMNRSIKHR